MIKVSHVFSWTWLPLLGIITKWCLWKITVVLRLNEVSIDNCTYVHMAYQQWWNLLSQEIIFQSLPSIILLMLINVALTRPSACISMTIHESDSCKEMVCQLRICLTLSLTWAQYTLDFSFELRCAALKRPTHTKKLNSHSIPWSFLKNAGFPVRWIWM